MSGVFLRGASLKTETPPGRAGIGQDGGLSSPSSFLRRHNPCIHKEGFAMMTFYYAPGACSMAAHIVLEESGEKYQPQKVDLAGGEQRTEAYLKINPQGRVPAQIGRASCRERV